MKRFPTQQEFLDWLAKQPASMKFKRRSSCECPLAAFLLAMGWQDPRVQFAPLTGIGLAVRDATFGSPYIPKSWLELPGWARRLVDRIDDTRKGDYITVRGVRQIVRLLNA